MNTHGGSAPETLEHLLQSRFSTLRSTTALPAARYARVASPHSWALLAGVRLVVAAGIVIALLTAGAKTIVTGSVNPLVWGAAPAATSAPLPSENASSARTTPTTTSPVAAGSVAGGAAPDLHSSPRSGRQPGQPSHAAAVNSHPTSFPGQRQAPTSGQAGPPGTAGTPAGPHGTDHSPHSGGGEGSMSPRGGGQRGGWHA